MKQNSQKFISSLAGGIFLLSSLGLNTNLAFAAASTTTELTALATASGTAMSVMLDPDLAKPTASADLFGGDFSLSYASGTLRAVTELKVDVLSGVDLPWQVDLVSQVYEFSLGDPAAHVTDQPFTIKLRPARNPNLYQQIFYFSTSTSRWLPLKSQYLAGSQRVQARVSLPVARVAVFSYPGVLATGRASWYSYKKGLFTASPDFPKGSKLRVTNLVNNKFVDVTVNDFGPDRGKHPDRVVDLDKVAFKKIANVGAGTVKVRIEPLFIPSNNGETLGVANAGVGAEPALASKAAVAINSRDGSIVWQKASTSTLPIASLTKLLSIKVFLDTRPTLNKVVTYLKQDEEYNYRYAKRGTVARLTVKDGDTLTIEDLLYSALVGSANNAIESLVRVSGLTRDEFIAKMNAQAAAWGASSSQFVEPTGLAPENVSSALDYAIIASKTLDHPIIEKASKIKYYLFYTKNTKARHYIKNSNSLIAMNRLTITGSKTGYLDEAAYCLMTRARDSKGREVIAVTLGTPSREMSFGETEDLINYALKKL